MGHPLFGWFITKGRIPLIKQHFSIQSITESLASHPEYDGHEEVVFCEDSETGLQALIAIHSTTLGPSLGGSRRWKYSDRNEAVTDVLRLSKGMSYKHAIAGTRMGGGKAVMIANPDAEKTPALMRAFGRFVDSLEGRYITAEDVGTSVQDMLSVREETENVSGLPIEHGGSGDPSPMTAYGTYCGILASLAWNQGLDQQEACNSEVVKDRVIAVQGLGHVGMDLCQQLFAAGAKLIVADVNAARVEEACHQFKAIALPPDEIATAEADLFAPCALGGILNTVSIPNLGAAIVAGAANNQLMDDEDGARLHQQGVLYAPDFVINAGGIINIANEKPTYDADKARTQTQEIANTLWQIFQRSRETNRPTSVVADELARQKLLVVTP
ncbi:MAG: Glu/Leu/Phe/Val dehydrogenase dimerization domain-containing protein [Pirellulaceae bacterium]|nr:Glu/Leu/Phe/Val dehydrogenase dimerization domain-containing protein [Pirellulaceae bacterium]MDG2104081.1 Glu/Leu/Phe/Val dehydrogenase dimerization domain-containing protein [Pirellulaceae bacterium]